MRRDHASRLGSSRSSKGRGCLNPERNESRVDKPKQVKDLKGGKLD